MKGLCEKNHNKRWRQFLDIMIMKREKILFFTLLALVVAVVVYSPLHFGFIYPTGGDDTANHITNLKNITADFSQIKNLSYYGIVLLLPLTKLGISPLIVFSVFNYAVIVAIFCVLWILVRRFYGLLGAVLSFYITVFIVMGTWYYFDDGTIFNIFNLWVVGVLAIFGLCSWLQTGSYRWLIMSGLLFIMASLVHSTTYLYMLAAMLLFIPGFAILQFVKKDRAMLNRVLGFGVVFILSILTASVTWMHKTLPSLAKPMVNSITQGGASFVTPFDFTEWVIHYLDLGAELLLAIALVTLLIMSLKGKPEENKNAIAKLNQPLTYIILAFIIVLSLGTFTKLGYDSDRFGRDLATFVGLSTAILLGIVLTCYRYKFNYLSITVLLVVLLISNTPLHKWLGDYSAMRPCDVQTVNFLNDIPASQMEVQVSPTVAPWIFELYTSDNINYTRTFDLKNFQDADYIIYRNNDMTYLTKTNRPKIYQPINNASLRSMGSLIKVAEFDSGSDKIWVYKVDKTIAENLGQP